LRPAAPSGGFWRLSLAQCAQLGRIIRQGSFIVLAIALPQLGLGAVAIGQWEQLLFIGFLLGTAWLPAFTQGLLVRYPLEAKTSREAPEALFAATVLVQFGVALLLALLLWLARGALIPLLTGQASLPYLAYFLVYLVFEWTGQLLEGLYLARRQGSRLLAYAVFSYTGLLLCWLLPLATGYPLSYVFFALAGLGIGKGVWILIETSRCFNSHFNKSKLVRWFSIVSPLLLYGLIAMIAGGLDPWLVGYYYAGDEAVFATYRYGARELPLIAALTIGLSQALIPRITADRSAGLAELRRECQRLLHLIFPVAIALLVSAEWWFPRVFTATFREAAVLFQVLLLTTIPRMFFNNTVFIALGAGRVLNRLVGIELLCNLGLSLVLLPYYGLWGLCLATVIALAIEKALGCWWLARRYGIFPGDYCPLRLWSVYSITLFGAWWLSL
jgi:O-antigen/teichoic acid export membrane protein